MVSVHTSWEEAGQCLQLPEVLPISCGVRGRCKASIVGKFGTDGLRAPLLTVIRLGPETVARPAAQSGARRLGDRRGGWLLIRLLRALLRAFPLGFLVSKV